MIAKWFEDGEACELEGPSVDDILQQLAELPWCDLGEGAEIFDADGKREGHVKRLPEGGLYWLGPAVYHGKYVVKDRK